VSEFQDTAGAFHSFLLDDGVFTQIDVPGATATSAAGINDRGQIVGPSWMLGACPVASFSTKTSSPRAFLVLTGFGRRREKLLPTYVLCHVNRSSPWFQTTGFQPFSLSVGGEVRRKLLNPPAFSWWSFSDTINVRILLANPQVAKLVCPTCLLGRQKS
jgi:hypothetical protein